MEFVEPVQLGRGVLSARTAAGRPRPRTASGTAGVVAAAPEVSR